MLPPRDIGWPMEKMLVSGTGAPEVRSLHLLYHEVSPTPSHYSYVIAKPEFAEHLALFSELQHAQLQPVLTFDDGHLSNFEHALPLLENHGVRAQFFITAGWTGTRNGYMGWAELRQMAKAGHTIGAHGWSHKLLTHCTDSELEMELVTARKQLEDKLGDPVTSLSFPGGRFDQRILHRCFEAGYTHLYTSAPRAESIPSDQIIGRLNVRQNFSAAWMRALFSDGGRTLRKLQREDRIKTRMKKLLGDRMYAGLWSVLNRESAEAV